MSVVLESTGKWFTEFRSLTDENGTLKLFWEITLPAGMIIAVRYSMVLARLETTQLKSQRARDQAALAAAESQLPQLQTSIDRQKATLAAETDLRRAQLAQAEALLRDLLAGARTQEVQQSQALVEEARSHKLMVNCARS